MVNKKFDIWRYFTIFVDDLLDLLYTPWNGRFSASFRTFGRTRTQASTNVSLLVEHHDAAALQWLSRGGLGA